MDKLYELSQKFIKNKNQVYRRYFIQKTTLNEQLSILVGQRGIGKTTILIQYLLDYVQNDLFSSKILYVPSDHLTLAETSLYGIAEQFERSGGEFIAFDEIHKISNWSALLKSIHDTFPKLKILASGSSALEIYKGSHDLSRRAIVYHIQSLSFREYLEMAFNITLSAITFEDLLLNHQKHSHQITSLLESSLKEKILPLFQDYLKHGFYPYWFILRDQNKFEITLEQNIHTTLEADLSSIYPHLSGSSIKKIRRLLTFIAQNVPYTPNWSDLSRILEIGDERTLKQYFTLLEEAELILPLYKSSQKLHSLGNLAKIYLHNPNLAYAIGKGSENIGAIRELFLLNMLHKNYDVTLPLNGDFLINKTILLEVGGANKTAKQIKGYQKAYLALDNVEIGINNTIPLWLFGFIY